MRSTRPLTTAALAALALTCFTVAGAAPITSAAPQTEQATLAATWLSGEITDNGNVLPYPPPFGGNDYGLTSDAIIALERTGHGDEPVATAATTALAAGVNDYITGEAFGDTGSHYAGAIGKTLVAATLQDKDVTSFGGVNLEALSRAAMETTGPQAGRFSDVSMFGNYSNGLGGALNIIGLSYTAAGVPAQALTFLLAQQCPAGGFRLYYDTMPASAGCETDDQLDSDATALAMQALEAVPPTPAITTAIGRAADWLITRQDATSGGFGGAGPTVDPNANTTGLAVQALSAAGRSAAADKGTAYVLGLQLTAAATIGTPAFGEEGAIALNATARAAALSTGIADNQRDQFRRATAQAMLAFGAAPLGLVPAAVTVTPGRLLDTRSGQPTLDGAQSGAGQVAPGTFITLPVVGRGGVPADAEAVVVNVTADKGLGNGYVTVWPCDETRPVASNLNFVAGTSVANTVITKLSAAGTVCLYVNGNAADLIADVTGYFPNGTGYEPRNPARLLDTRSGFPTVDNAQSGAGQVAPGTFIEVPVTGRTGITANVDAVSLNVTVDGGQGDGFVTVWPCTSPRPLASSLNFGLTTSVANAVVTKLSATGTVCLFVNAFAADLIVDISGTFPIGSGYKGLEPARLLDTRPDQPTVDGAHGGFGVVAADTFIEVPVAGRGGVPTTARSAVLNVTAVDGIGDGYVTVWPCDQTRPTTSSVNFGATTAVPNAVITKLSATGTVCLYVHGNGVQLVADVNGYFG